MGLDSGRSLDAAPQLAAPAEGGSGAEEGEGAWGRWRNWREDWGKAEGIS